MRYNNVKQLFRGQTAFNFIFTLIGSTSETNYDIVN